MDVAKRQLPLARRLTLTQQVAILSLIPMVLLGFVLCRLLQRRIVERTLSDETRTAQLIAHIGIQPRLSPHDLAAGLSGVQIRELDRQLRNGTVKRDLARIKIWNAHDTIVYSDDHSLIGRVLQPSDDLEHALEGRPGTASVVTPTPYSETAGEVGLGTLVEVYVPLRFAPAGPPQGAFEMYLSYRPIAGAIASDKRMVALVIGCGLALLWLVLFRIVARASRRLRRQADENERLARFDQLTGLPNRTGFAALVAGPAARGGAVLTLDLDGFHAINSTLGSATGDGVLRAVAERLLAELGTDAVVARLGDDEFAAYVPCAPGQTPDALIRRVQRTLEPVMAIGALALDVEATIGLALADAAGADPLELLRHAEAALSRARASGSRAEIYSPERDRFDPDRLLLLGQVRQALERHEFVLHYQPKLDFASGRIRGVEALVRWQHPERGLLAPMQFVPLIEPTGLVAPVTLYVFDEALRQAAEWRRAGLELSMSVNLSARNLVDAGLPAQLLEILERHDLSPDAVIVEVTESATMSDPDRAIRALTTLRERGVGVSIDDFGTGHASIDYLARLPASELKIDRAFVTDICDDERAQAIVRATIDLARHLDLTVVAEGIETAAAMELLVELGCDTGQGYLISRPVPPAELARAVGAAQGDEERPRPRASRSRPGLAQRPAAAPARPA